MRMRLLAGIAGLAWTLPVAADAPAIKPVPGLVLTTTVHANIVTSARGGVGYMDTEDLVSLSAVGPEGLTYSIRMSAPGTKVAEELKKFKLTRKVRREDLEQSSRMTMLYSNMDPESYGGQTFVETSTKVLTALKTSGETPFVFGPYTGLHGVSSAEPSPTPAAAALDKAIHAGNPQIPDMSAMLGMLFGSARHYYRGTLKRVEPGDVPFSVLINGVRTTVPAVHAAGDVSFSAEDRVHAEIWWLNNPAYALNLKWVFGPGSFMLTRIDMPVDEPGAGGGMAAKLASKDCRVELHGIYFNTGSAVLLEESEPMLKKVAALIKSSGDASLTIEGHTDNIGSAAYNQSLSEQRAEAVRQALVSRYAVPATRLSAKGLGLTRPVETNDTYEGRARNRRVELARPCAAGH